MTRKSVLFPVSFELQSLQVLFRESDRRCSREGALSSDRMYFLTRDTQTEGSECPTDPLVSESRSWCNSTPLQLVYQMYGP